LLCALNSSSFRRSGSGTSVSEDTGSNPVWAFFLFDWKPEHPTRDGAAVSDRHRARWLRVLIWTCVAVAVVALGLFWYFVSNLPPT
jgi:hypothetical protein